MTLEELSDGQLAAQAAQLLDLKEANEKLVLAAIHAHELVEEAESARAIAEAATRMADKARAAAERATERVEAALARAAVTNQELAQSERELRDTGRLREELIGVVSHDLRNPLMAILVSARHLASESVLEQEDADMVGRISRSAGRMQRLIEYLVEFTRARLGGGLLIALGPADLRVICRRVVEELEVRSTCPLHCEFEGDLIGNWDSDRLEEAISNIAGNAIEYAAPGSVVVVHAWAEGPWANLEITNHGDAIPADVLPHLFEPFRRGRPREKSKASHLGLGLYIAQQIFFSHGGAVTASSSNGITTFAMRLLRSDAPAASGVAGALSGS